MRKICIFLLFLLMSTTCAAGLEVIDFRARETPPLRTESGLERLVKYLVKPYKSDIAKARAIYAWIVYNIDYDDYKMKHLGDTDEIVFSFEMVKDPQTGRDVIADVRVKEVESKGGLETLIETRLGTCGDIAKLFKRMAEYAGLEAVTIGGWGCDARNSADEVMGHMWNAVKLGGKWEYVDATWAVCDGGGRANLASMRESEYRSELRDRRYRWSENKEARKYRVVPDQWFMTPKDQMIWSHFPYDSRWQLQDGKVLLDTFLKHSCHTTIDSFLSVAEKRNKKK